MVVEILKLGAPAQGGYHLSEWAESGHALHRVVAVAEIGTAPQEMLMGLRKVGDTH